RQPFMMLPTARAARGTPAAAATSPYVATPPTGMRRTAGRTRRVNASEEEPDSRANLRASRVDGDRPSIGRHVDARARDLDESAGDEPGAEHPERVGARAHARGAVRGVAGDRTGERGGVVRVLL